MDTKAPVTAKKIIKKRKKKPMKYRVLFRSISLIMIVLSIILFIMVARLNILGLKYIFILLGSFILIETLVLFVLNKRFKVGFKIPFFIIALLISGISIFGIYNVQFLTKVVSDIAHTVAKEEEYNIYVLKDSSYNSINDLNKTLLGIFNNGNDTLDEALKELNKQVTFKDQKQFDDLELLFKEGIAKKIDVIYISSSLNELLNEEYFELIDQYKMIGSIQVKIEQNIEKTNVDVTKEPFLMYISGNDAYGSIKNVSRSDVNILVAVNPKTNKILLVNTPRDYYVLLHSKKAYDKLTHAGIYGVKESMNTLADLYATEVDFYLNINFTSLIKIVDALGGIEVDSKYSFSYDGFNFRKGKNQLGGKAALAFSRFRKGLPGGDVARGENQEAVIKAMVEKISNPSIISKYTTILKTISKSFSTNMSEEDIFKLANFQLNENPKWSIETQNASGKDGYKSTYSAGKTQLYVMIPDEYSVTEVKNKLNEILEED